MSALGLLFVAVLAADADPLKPARVAFGEGDADGCLAVIDRVLATKPVPQLMARAQFQRAQCLNMKDGPSRATQALEAALDADPELVIDAARVDPQLVGLFEGIKQRQKSELIVSADRPDAEVMLDGAVIGAAPTTVKVLPGRHRVVVRTRDGRFSKERELVAYPRRTYELALELAQVSAPVTGVEGPVEVAKTKTWVNGLFLDGRVMVDAGNGVGFEVGAGWAARHFAASAHFVIGGYLGGSLRLGGRLPLANDHLIMGVGAEVPLYAVPGEGGGLAVGLGGNLSAALHFGIVEPFVEVGVQGMLSAPARSSGVQRVSPLLVGGVRLFVP